MPVAWEDITTLHRKMNLSEDSKWLFRKCLICSCFVFSQWKKKLLVKKCHFFLMYFVWNTLHLIYTSLSCFHTRRMGMDCGACFWTTWKSFCPFCEGVFLGHYCLILVFKRSCFPSHCSVFWVKKHRAWRSNVETLYSSSYIFSLSLACWLELETKSE